MTSHLQRDPIFNPGLHLTSKLGVVTRRNDDHIRCQSVGRRSAGELHMAQKIESPILALQFARWAYLHRHSVHQCFDPDSGFQIVVSNNDFEIGALKHKISWVWHRGIWYRLHASTIVGTASTEQSGRSLVRLKHQD